MATETLSSLGVDEETLRAIVENSSDAIVVIDGAGRTVYRSELIHPDDVDRARTALADVVAGRVNHVRSEITARHKDGSWRTLDTMVTNLLDNPSVRGLLVVARDVTQQRAVEAERARLLDSE